MTKDTTALHVPAGTAPQRERSDRPTLTAELLRRAARERDGLERRRLQDEVVVLNMGVAASIARGYRARWRGEGTG